MRAGFSYRCWLARGRSSSEDVGPGFVGWKNVPGVLYLCKGSTPAAGTVAIM